MTLGQLGNAIAAADAAPSMPVKLVAVDGHGGAGKTELAKKLAVVLQAEVLHTDDFASYNNPLDWWPRLIEDVLDPIRSGAKSLNYKRGAWYKDHKPESIVNQPVTKTMILEGVSASRPEFRPYISYAIWVDTPKEIYMKRGIDRDLANKEVKKTYDELVEEWNQNHVYEDEYVSRDKPQAYADVVIDGTKKI